MTTQKKNAVDNGSTLQAKSLCLAVSFSQWGIRRTIGITPDAETQADKAMLSTSKRLLIADEVRAISAADHDLKQWLSRKCVSFPLQRSVFLVPVAILSEVQAKLEEADARRSELVEALVKAMPELKREARRRLVDLYDESEYPAGKELRALYTINHAYVSFDVPGMLKDLDNSLFTDEKRRAQIRWKEAAEEIQVAMREAFAQLVRGLTEKLTPSTDGKKRVIRDSSVDSLKEFIDGFSVRNLTDDQELAKMVERARKIVSGIDPADLRKDEGTRERIAADMQKVCDAIGPMIEAKPRRRFVNDD